MSTKAEKALREIRAELKKLPTQSPNWAAIERLLADTVKEVRRIATSNEIFLPRDVVERLVQTINETGAALQDRKLKDLAERLRKKR